MSPNSSLRFTTWHPQQVQTSTYGHTRLQQDTWSGPTLQTEKQNWTIMESETNIFYGSVHLRIRESKRSTWMEIWPLNVSYLLFLLFIDDLTMNLTSTTRLRADICLIFQEISSTENHNLLHNDIDRLVAWIHKRQMNFNTENCYIVRISLAKNLLLPTCINIP